MSNEMLKGEIKVITDYKKEIQDILNNGQTYFYFLENADSIDLGDSEITLEDMKNFKSGRLFNRDVEIRWKNGLYLKLYENTSGACLVNEKTINIYCWSDDIKIPFKWQEKKKKPKFIEAFEYKKGNTVQHLRFKRVEWEVNLNEGCRCHSKTGEK